MYYEYEKDSIGALGIDDTALTAVAAIIIEEVASSEWVDEQMDKVEFLKGKPKHKAGSKLVLGTILFVQDNPLISGVGAGLVASGGRQLFNIFTKKEHKTSGIGSLDNYQGQNLIDYSWDSDDQMLLEEIEEMEEIGTLDEYERENDNPTQYVNAKRDI